MSALLRLLVVLFCTSVAVAHGQTGQKPRPMTEAAFTTFVAARFNEMMPDLETGESWHLRQTVKGASGAHDVFLDNAYREYQMAPQDLEDIVERFAAVSRDLIEGAKDLQSALHVIACVRGEPEAYTEHGIELNPLEEIAPGLFRCLCVDGGSFIRILQPEEIALLRDNTSDIDTIAVANITTFSDAIEMHNLSNGLGIVTSGRNYEASLVLRDDAWDDLHAKFGPSLIFGLPNRDLFIVADEENVGAVEQVREQTRRSFVENAYPLSGRLYFREVGRISEYQP